MFENLPIPVPAESQLGQLLAQLEAAEAAALQQRVVATAAVEAYRNTELGQRRAAYRPSSLNPSIEALEADRTHLQELERKRDLEARKTQLLLDAVRELRERFSRDYQEFYRLRTSMEELKRLAG